MVLCEKFPFLFDQSGSRVLSCDWHFHYVQVSSFQAVTPATLSSHSGVVYGVTYSADGAYIASCSSDKTCKIWSLAGSPAVTDLAENLASMLNISIS